MVDVRLFGNFPVPVDEQVPYTLVVIDYIEF